MSMVDICRLLGLSSNPVNYHSSNPHVFPAGAFATPDLTLYGLNETPSTSRLLSPRDLAAIANPELTMAVRKIVQPLRLPCFEQFSQHHGSKSQMEAHVAPFALLASLTKSFVHLLVRSGLDAASLDMSMAAAKAKAQGRSIRKTKQPRDHLLTPSHIIRGLSGGSIQRDRPLAATISFCLARLGLGVSTSQPVTMATRAG
jgi:hypothetical protein